jgi:hypothetical protein
MQRQIFRRLAVASVTFTVAFSADIEVPNYDASSTRVSVIKSAYTKILILSFAINDFRFASLSILMNDKLIYTFIGTFVYNVWRRVDSASDFPRSRTYSCSRTTLTASMEGRLYPRLVELPQASFIHFPM